MSQPFLEEQLKRIREMSEQISEAHSKIGDIGRASSIDRPSQDTTHAQHRPARRRHPAGHRRR